MCQTCGRLAGDIDSLVVTLFWGDGSELPFGMLTTAVAALVSASFSELDLAGLLGVNRPNKGMLGGLSVLSC